VPGNRAKPRDIRVQAPSPPVQAGGVHVVPFLQLMGAPGSGARISSLDADPYVLELAGLTAARLLAAEPALTPATSVLLAFVMSQARHSGSLLPRQAKVTEVAVTALMLLLGNESIRAVFVEVRAVLGRGRGETGVPSCSPCNTHAPIALSTWVLAATRYRHPRAAARCAQHAAAL
jgi:hypothetical protein